MTIQRATEAADAAGQLIRTWATFKANVPASVQSVSGGEVFRGRQVSSETSSVVLIPFREDLLTTDRLIYGTRTLGIVRVADLWGDRRELRVECKEET